MLATIVCAVLCGAQGFEAIAQWIHAQRPELWYLLGYFRRPPTSGAFRYLLTKLSPDVLEQALREWIVPLIADTITDEGAQAIALDGKTLCGTLGEHGRHLQLL